MIRNKVLYILVFFYCISVLQSQNDVDALRYSRSAINGTPRSIAMGGAFGALGADMSCATSNPAGLGLYTKGEMMYSGGLRFSNNSSTFNGKKTSSPNGNFVFTNFGLAYSFGNDKDPSKRNTFCFSNTQLQNFNDKIQITDASCRNSIAGDMLNLANLSKSVSQLNSAYESLGYNSYVLDYDSTSGNFFSFVDLKRNISLNRTIATSGRMNELNLSLAQSSDDKFYIGASLGIPKIKFESTTTHSEVDGNDSMRIVQTSPTTFSSTYVDPLPIAYTDLLGFNSLTYKEYYKTVGYGLNLKLGGVVRFSKSFRMGAYFHSPSILYLSDEYSYSLTSTFDKSKTAPIETTFPDKKGLYDYRIITPLKYGFNGAYIFNSLGALSIDIENINYGKASLTSSTPSDFTVVNEKIKNKYKTATNIRVGTELNVKPVMVRFGYAMNSNPFGGFFSGPFDRQTVSFGMGVRTKNNMFFDFAWAKTFSKEKYFMYSTMHYAKTDLVLTNTLFTISAGIKF